MITLLYVTEDKEEFTSLEEAQAYEILCASPNYVERYTKLNLALYLSKYFILTRKTLDETNLPSKFSDPETKP